ncbi:MAG: nucleotidyltransferase family protein [Roseobacter sp.]
MFNEAAIILAAGQSIRMGVENKLLLPVGQVPMIRHVVLQYRAAIDGPITVVTGYEASRVQNALKDIDVMCVFNPGFADGQQGSVGIGLQHSPPANVLLIGLGDQPLLNTHDICALVAAHHRNAPDKVTIPEKDGKRGNPIVVPHRLRALLTADPDRPGCMQFTRANPSLTHRQQLNAQGFYADIDTPKEYSALCLTEGLSQ